MLPSNSKTSVGHIACGLVLLVGASLPAFAESRRKTGDDCLSDGVCSGLYEEARRLSKSGDLQAALVAYQTAYRRQPAPWLLINIGRTLQKLGRLQEALTHYQRYATAEPNGPAERQQMIREYTAQAEKALAEKTAAASVPEKPPESSTAPEEPPPPPLVVEKPVVPPPPPVVEKTPMLETAAPPMPSWKIPAYFWAGLGIGGALLVSGAITGGLALSQSHTLQETAYAGPASDALLDQQSRVRGLAASTDALLAIGGATIGAVTIAVLVQRYRHRGERSSASAGTLQAGLGGLSGRF